ncbi:Signal transduction histidine-protein kinase BarA [Gimesia panareensis]|uniref:histidine kinase n=1 Tax=Gimesia panareensis TaxID=2527978 RepID=A0A517Q816_9PLAN|nr:PAS domain S-box protein [Gimesia panareensis]QDT27763.1 Signal transduction histidine-protein kinase BarA [Gimesia panareensis]
MRSETVLKVRARGIWIACLLCLLLSGLVGSTNAADTASAAPAQGCPGGHCALKTAKPELQAEGPATFFAKLFDTNDFPQRWYCGTWSTDVGWLHILSDIAIFGAYFTIPVMLLYFLLQRKDLPFPRIIWLFAAFILFCGFGHLIEAGIFWWPVYRFAGLIKACTAIVSWITVFVLIRLIPEALKLPSAALLAKELQHSQERLDFALEAGQIGVWELDLKTDNLQWDRRTREIFDVDPSETDLCFEDFSKRLHPDDRERVEITFNKSVETGTSYSCEYRIIHRNGTVHYIYAHGHAIYGDNGKPRLFVGVCHDYTEKQLQKNALSESEQNFRSTFEQVAMGIAHVSPDGRWLRVNHGLCEILGYENQELLERNWQELTHPDDLETDLKNTEKLLAGEIDSYSVEKRYLTCEQTVVWTNMTVSLVRLPTGEPRHFIFLIENIQGRKEAEKALQMYHQKVKKLSLVASKTKHSVIISDAQGYIEWVNDAFTSLTGYSLNEVMERHLCEILQGPETCSETIASIKAHLQRKESIATEIVNYDRDGREYWIELKIDPVLDDDDILLNFIATQVDVTARKQSELALRIANSQFSKLRQADILGIMTCRFDGRVEQANDELLRILGYSNADLEEGLINCQELTPEEWQQRDREVLQEMLETGAAKPIEKEYFRKDGSRVPVVLGMTRLDEAEDLCLCFVLDATAQKETEEKLKVAKQAAEEASQAKSEFLANMSHELRTPLNGVIGMTELLAGTSLSQQQQEFVNACRNSGESLLNLINDILDFSKIEAGKLDLDLHNFDLEKLVMDTMSTMVWRASEKNLELPCAIDPATRLILKGDSYRLRQVLVNLVGNAIKFTEAGEVSVRTEAVDQSAEQITIRFTVSDTGIGISQDKLNRLFQSFTQVDASTTRNDGGSGLGLVISRNLVELMGGSIGIESQEGAGSTFWFEIPFDSISPTSVALPIRSPLAGRRALIVDDNQKCLQILQNFTREWELAVETASTVAEALSILERAHDNEQTIDLVLTDLDLPDLSGLVLARELKGSGPKVVLISRSPETLLSQSDLEESGVDALVHKPLLRHKLYEVVCNLLNQQHSLPQPQRTPPAQSDENQVILPATMVLLAEDNTINQMYVTEMMKQFGCLCHTAVNGLEAIEAVLNHDYDLVLMDCQMPELDGLEATRRIRQLEQEGELDDHLPIIAITANAIKGDRERCLEAGMDDYLSKPVQKAQIKKLLKKLHGIKAGHQQTKPEETETAVPDRGAIDTESLLELCSGNLELIDSLLDELESTGEDRVTQIRKQAEQDNALGVAEAAHSLKGATSILCATSLQQLSKEIELAGKEDHLENIEALIKTLSEEMQRCLSELPQVRDELKEKSDLTD